MIIDIGNFYQNCFTVAEIPSAISNVSNSTALLCMDYETGSPKTKYYRDYRKFDIDYFNSG